LLLIKKGFESVSVMELLRDLVATGEPAEIFAALAAFGEVLPAPLVAALAVFGLALPVPLTPTPVAAFAVAAVRLAKILLTGKIAFVAPNVPLREGVKLAAFAGLFPFAVLALPF